MSANTEELALIERFQRLQFRNHGIVTRDMKFEYQTRPCYYMEDVDLWSTVYGLAYYSYLYQMEGGRHIDPPLGMRSAVPLGGLGAGTVELRADGSLRDWTIFNNSPAGGGKKVQLEDAFFAIRVCPDGERACTRVLRTHPPKYLPAVEKIEYSGAFPVSRLKFGDKELAVDATLFAYSELQLRDSEASATPAINFSFLLHNPTSRSVDVSVLCHLPNYIGGEIICNETLRFHKAGKTSDSGEIMLGAFGNGVKTRGIQSDSVHAIMNQFHVHGTFNETAQAQANGRGEVCHPRSSAALAATTHLEAGETKLITFVLAWYFPHRYHAGERLGNHYANLYANAEDVLTRVARRFRRTLDGILEWQRLCFENTLPAALQDAMVNSLATIAKTGMWFQDGRWRQWESFSCPGVDPIHIHFYRVLPYAWFFPDLQRNQLRGYASRQQENGYIQENLGRATSPLDEPHGRMMGDGATTFILEVYQIALWSGDFPFCEEFWPHVRAAAQWQINRAQALGLPNRLNNSYDWWGFEHKDLVSYNAFLHIAALMAAGRLAVLVGDHDFAETCSTQLAVARQVLRTHLWNGDYFRAWRNMDREEPESLMTDTPYGELWARILDLEHTVDPEMLISHLVSERERNASPYGLKVMRIEGRRSDALRDDLHDENAPRPRDELVWQAGSLDWAALNLFLSGDVSESLEEALKIIEHWRDRLRDFWDIRDLTTAWDGTPWCNSHYARHLILWAIPLALSGQRYSTSEKRLSFDPKVAAPARLPFFTPVAHGVLELREGIPPQVTVFSGNLELDVLTVSEKSLSGPITLKSGQSVTIP